MIESHLTKGINKTDMSGTTGRGRPRKSYIELIGEVLQNGQVSSTRNQRACIRYMNVEEARGSLPPWERGVSFCMYVGMYVSLPS